MSRAALFLCLAFVACQQKIAGELSDASANQTLLFLERVGIGAAVSSEKNLSSIWVSRADAASARQLLQENNLPTREPRCTPDSLFPSPQEESDAKRACLAYTLAERIRQLDGVISASVLLPSSSAAQWPLSESPITEATVLYKYQESPVSEENIKIILSSSLASAPKISIIAQPLSIKGSEWVSVGPFAVSPSSARPLLFSLLALTSFGVGAVFACLSLWFRQRRLRSSAEASP
jgi:type III secretory pathway lipoprotein EscJ